MIPPCPPARGYETTGSATLWPRYEDITQDGRVLLHAFMPGLGAAVWRSMMKQTGTHDSFRARGILPILRRLVVEGTRGPFSVHVPIEFEGTWRLARETGGDRLFLDMWLEAFAKSAVTLGPPPPESAEEIVAGRVYAEHVITKPFAPAHERKVTRLDAPGLPEMPEDEHPFEDAAALLEGWALEPAGEIAFGMMHTDSNQHVNSLVYPRLFEEAVVRRLAELGEDPARASLLARAIELRWRKPFFAGDRARLALAIDPTGREAVGAFYPLAEGPEAKASCTVRLLLE